MLTFSVRSAPVRASRRLVITGSAFVACVAIASLSACKDFTSVNASFDNVTDSLDFYPINGSPPGTATAISLFTGVRSRANETFAYDIAFDIDANGRVVVIPVRALASGLASPVSVGLQVVPGTTFNALDQAPKAGYVADSTVTVGIGAVVAIESHDFNTCQFAIKGQSFFSKLVVTAIDATNRKISTVIEVNRNCGFRSFAPGRPKD